MFELDQTAAVTRDPRATPLLLMHRRMHGIQLGEDLRRVLGSLWLP
jgi:hypothetical protein